MAHSLNSALAWSRAALGDTEPLLLVRDCLTESDGGGEAIPERVAHGRTAGREKPGERVAAFDSEGFALDSEGFALDSEGFARARCSARCAAVAT